MGTPASAVVRRHYVWLLCVLIVAGAAQLAGGLVLLARFDRQVGRFDRAESAHMVMLQSMTDAETGLRGWQLTGEQLYLEPYQAGVQNFPAAARQVLTDVGDPELRTLVDAEESAADEWLNDFAAPTVATSARYADVGQGKALFDAYRERHAAASAALTASRRQAARSFRVSSTATQGALAGLTLVAVLVTVRLGVRTQRLREEQRRYLGEVLDTLTIGVVAAAADGSIVWINRAARDGIEQMLPSHVDEFDRALERTGAQPAEGHPLRVALAGHSIRGREMTYVPPGRPPIEVMVDAGPLRDERGEIIGAVASRYDITALREREAELTAFAGVVAHDLRAPLAAIAGHIELLEQDLDAMDELDEFRYTLDRVRNSADRMCRLIDDLLAYATARDAPLRLEPVDLSEVVDEVVHERTAHLRKDRAPRIEAGPLPTVRADPAMIRQMMDNLIGNAIKYTRDSEPAQVRITADRLDDAWAEIQVSDRGIGIPSDQRTSIFESFSRAHRGQSYAGTGLGLAICRRVVDRHGGTISVDDNPLGGARFHIVLPTEPGE
ncbi:ATP-binding protein [Actinoplanes sp. NPDC051411]|uniref:sensor histidine kinase n=1 Tax=Actinoplanes sp. NPDC051411 TaxID=3155522 RepID=UPI00343C26CD